MLLWNWESLSRCPTKSILVYKKLPLVSDCGQSKYSLWIFNMYIYIYIYIYIHIYIYSFNFGRDFCGSFSMLFPEAPDSCDKEILKWFLLHCVSVSMGSKSASQIFKILFQTQNISIFVPHGVLSWCSTKKLFFGQKKALAVESEIR